MTNQSTITLYRITATLYRDGEAFAMDQAEVLGNACGKVYASREEAESLAEDMQDDLADYGLDPATEYAVEEVDATISDVSTDLDARADVDDDSVSYTVTADVRIGGVDIAPGRVLSWSARPRHTTAGVDGLEPSGDSIDCWADGPMLATYGGAVSIRIGLEVLALAARSL